MKICAYLAILLLTGFISCSENASQKTGGVQAPAEEVSAYRFTDLSAVTDIKKLLCQNWEHKEDAEDAAASGGGGSMEVPYRGMSFFADGSITENPRDNIRFGKWEYNDEKKLIDIVYDKGAKAHYKIGAIGPRQMILLNLADKSKTEYKSDAQAQMIPAEDPFYYTNNQWRIKPAHSETDSSIKLRVKQAVDFYAKFLNDNAGRGGNIISFVGLPTCFKWYSGGISITGQSKLEAKWINCFYNKDEAIKAQQMLEKIISKKYKWNKAETNWVKQSADVLWQMKDSLR